VITIAEDEPAVANAEEVDTIPEEPVFTPAEEAAI
jgi:hypothetical protein